MKTVDTRKETRYSPLISALEAILLSEKGTNLELILEKTDVLKEIKAYLIAKNIGFREIYDESCITLQFKI
ncbi:MAG: sulfurtransferase TusA family protein [Bacteroides sp.]